jgi:ribosomal protein S18 acetylase RimI-like enzyme
MFATIENLDGVYRLMHSVLDPPYAYTKEDISKLITGRNVYVVTVDSPSGKEGETEVIAFLILKKFKRPGQPEAQNTIIGFGVSKGYQGNGIGYRLLQGVVATVKMFDLYLEVRVSNKIAIKLYDKIGFKVVKVMRDSYINPSEDGYLMVLARKKIIYSW